MRRNVSIHASGRARCTSCPAPGITTRAVSGRAAHIRSTRAASRTPCSPNTSVVGTRSEWPRGREERGVCPDRLADQHDGLSAIQLVQHGHDVRDERFAADVRGLAATGTVSPLVERDSGELRTQRRPRAIPFPRVPGQPVQENDGP